MKLYSATTADPNPPSTNNEGEGTISATASTANPSISDERETIGCLVPTHPELSHDCEVLLCNDLTDNPKLHLM